MKKAGRKLLSLLLATLLILTLIPGVVWGAEEKLTEENVVENTEAIWRRARKRLRKKVKNS